LFLCDLFFSVQGSQGAEYLCAHLFAGTSIALNFAHLHAKHSSSKYKQPIKLAIPTNVLLNNVMKTA